MSGHEEHSVVAPEVPRSHRVSVLDPELVAPALWNAEI